MENILIDPFKRFIENVAEFLPNFLISIILVIVGVLIAGFLRSAITKVSLLLKIDALSDRLGITQIIQKGGFKEPLSKLAGQVVYWLVLISFVVMALDALKVPAVQDLLARFLLYLPNVIVAAIIIAVGYLLGNFLGRAALIAAVNAGLAISGLVGRFVKFTVFIMAATMALEMLGIGKDTVLIAFAIVFGGVVLAISIAFGLGGRDAAKEYIGKMLAEKKSEDDIKHI